MRPVVSIPAFEMKMFCSKKFRFQFSKVDQFHRLRLFFVAGGVSLRLTELFQSRSFSFDSFSTQFFFRIKVLFKSEAGATNVLAFRT